VRRTLSLRREPLAELATSDLASVLGANGSGPQPTPPQHVTLIELCVLSNVLTCKA
jgi:hypothetical protein